MADRIDSIIFDMDGTLWDALSTYTKAWNEYFKSEGNGRCIGSELLLSLMGVEEKILLGEILHDIKEHERSLIYKEKIIPLIYYWVEQDGGQLYEGVKDGLERLSKKYKLFIISNCPEKLIEYFMNWSKIHDSITDSIAHGQNSRSKCDNITLLKEKHQLISPVYVGDTDSDRLQSGKANVPFIYMDYGFGNCDQYQIKFSKFNDFVEFMLLTISDED